MLSNSGLFRKNCPTFLESKSGAVHPSSTTHGFNDVSPSANLEPNKWSEGNAWIVMGPAREVDFVAGL
jgi:hypothetical protein